MYEHEEANEDEANISIDEDIEELLVINKIESFPVIQQTGEDWWTSILEEID